MEKVPLALNNNEGVTVCFSHNYAIT